MTPLATTQRILWHLITAPEGAEQGVETLPNRGRVLPEGLDGLVRGDDRLSALARVDIYANMYFFRILEALKEDYPGVLAVVGPERFHNIVTDYLLVHPSTHPSLRWVGRHLPGFLETHELARRWPLLPDLARFEWAMLDAFDAADAEPLRAADLRRVAPEDWASLRLRLSPSVTLLDVAGPVDEIRAAANEGRDVPDVRSERTSLRVWRKGFRVLHRPVDTVERLALGEIARGAEFGTVCERVAAETGDAEAALRATALVTGWVADELLVKPGE